MKLIGSKTEHDLRKILVKSNELLFKSEENKRLLEVVRSLYPEMKVAYIIDWIPEQGEDIYKLLIDNNIILEIELDRNNAEIKPIIEFKSITQYLQGLSKQNQIKLGVALDLASKYLDNMNS
ncbi:hypothetical protein LAV73_12025 [Lysinibacillus xylanilyticus]|uniref:hypothetical protein n=1 Tax=Lysinibacillus xylanilyticus TaxID=582475 RepID=UPI002B252CA9|nr:hypothetical protein [Lysinibacillus xylanilyticus]MEB2280725.1 hypothetical protein [Lysinibacillus xylanilyticus]